jgi:hypothetical protein
MTFVVVAPLSTPSKVKVFHSFAAKVCLPSEIIVKSPIVWPTDMLESCDEYSQNWP